VETSDLAPSSDPCPGTEKYTEAHFLCVELKDEDDFPRGDENVNDLDESEFPSGQVWPLSGYRGLS